MMKINLDNYQEWALDYIEGNLSGEERCSFDLFLAQHADLAEDIYALQEDMPVLSAEQMIYPDKQLLLRGGRIMSLSRIGSFLGGAVAASLLIGLFSMVHNNVAQKEQLLTNQAQALLEEHNIPETESAEAVHPQVVQQKPEPRLAAATPSNPHTSTVSATSLQVSSGTEHVSSTEPMMSLTQPIITASQPTEQSERIHVQPLSETIGVKPQLAATTTERVVLRPLAITTAPVQQPTDKAELAGTRPSKVLNHALISLIAPLDQIIPIKTYRTEDERGIEIASIIRIGNKSQNK